MKKIPQRISKKPFLDKTRHFQYFPYFEASFRVNTGDMFHNETLDLLLLKRIIIKILLNLLAVQIFRDMIIISLYSMLIFSFILDISWRYFTHRRRNTILTESRVPKVSFYWLKIFYDWSNDRSTSTSSKAFQNLFSHDIFHRESFSFIKNFILLSHKKIHNSFFNLSSFLFQKIFFHFNFFSFKIF